MSEAEVSELAAALDGAGGGAEEYVLLGLPDRPERLSPRQGTQPEVVRGRGARRDGRDRPPARTPPGGRSDHDLRELRDPFGGGRPGLHPEVETLHELTWRTGWSVCIGTPTWRDGSSCEISVRETLRRVLDAMAELGHDVKAAFE